MNEHKKQIFQDHHHHHDHHQHKSWGLIANSDQESIEETSTISNEPSSSSSISSCSSFDARDDASSLPSSSSSSSSTSSLDANRSSSLLDLSDLMIQLPIKRGLSKFYQGKSESFTSLARVMSIEDLPKKIKNPYNKMRKMKANTLPKPIISKKHSSFLRQRSFARSTLVNKTTNGGI